MTSFHPKPRANGQKVTIHHPSSPTGERTWHDADATATFIPEGLAPTVLNGIAVSPITLAREAMNWQAWARSRDFHEPEFEPPRALNPRPGPRSSSPTAGSGSSIPCLSG